MRSAALPPALLAGMFALAATAPGRAEGPPAPPRGTPGPPPGAVTDATGTWTGWLSEALGARTDLWVMHRGPAGWSRPLFTGIAGHRADWLTGLSVEGDSLVVQVPRIAVEGPGGAAVAPDVAGEYLEAYDLGAADRLDRINDMVRRRLAGPSRPKGAGAKAGPRLVLRLQRRLLTLADLERDRDGDGWTDRVEARLHTDPASADTDGDGVPDPRDPSPLCAPRPALDDGEAARLAVAADLFGRDPGPEPRFLHATACLEVPVRGGPLIVLGDAAYHDLRRELPMPLVRYWAVETPVPFGEAARGGAGDTPGDLGAHRGLLDDPVPDRLPGDRVGRWESWNAPLWAAGASVLLRKTGDTWRVIATFARWES